MCPLGDGTTAIGAFHESLNLAALWKLPVVFVIINNGLGMGTTVDASLRRARPVQAGCAYRMAGAASTASTSLAVREPRRGGQGEPAASTADAARGGQRTAARPLRRRPGQVPRRGRGRAAHARGPAARLRREADRGRGRARRRGLDRRAIDGRGRGDVAAAVDFAANSPHPTLPRCSTTPTPRRCRSAVPRPARRPGHRGTGRHDASSPTARRCTTRCARRCRATSVFLMGEEIGVFEGSYKITAGLLEGVRREARARHPDRRGGLRRRRDRRRDARTAPGRRDDDDQLHPAGPRPDHQPRREDLRHVRRPGQRARWSSARPGGGGQQLAATHSQNIELVTPSSPA